MTAYLHRTDYITASPYVSLNESSLAAGDLLVTVVLADDHRTDLAFHDVEEIKPVLAALEKALELARQGQAELDRRAAEKAQDPEDVHYSAGCADGSAHAPGARCADPDCNRACHEPDDDGQGEDPAGDALPADVLPPPVRHEYEPLEPLPDDDQPVSYLACGDQLTAQAGPGAEVECPRHGAVAVVSREAYAEAATAHPDDPGDSGPEFPPAPAEERGASEYHREELDAERERDAADYEAAR